MTARSALKTSPAAIRSPLRGRVEHSFFSAMSLLILATTYYGFAQSYFRAGMFRAHLPNLIIHIHAAVFTGWIFLLVAQTSLVAAGQVRWHRRLGIAGFCLACLMMLVGFLAATDGTLRGGLPGIDPIDFYYVMLSEVLFAFPVLVYLAFRLRFNPAAHKRLILIATLVLIDAAIIRWPLRWVSDSPLMTSAVVYSFLFWMVLYDLWSVRKIHPATLWGGAFLILFRETQGVIGSTRAWHSVAAWLLSLMGKSR